VRRPQRRHDSAETRKVRVEQLKSISLETLKGMAEQAEQEARRALRIDMSDSRKQRGTRPMQADKRSGALHKITEPPPRRETDTGTTTLCSPKDMLNHKTSTSTQIWKCDATPRGEHKEHLIALRAKAAEEEERDPWALDDLDRCTKALVDLFNERERHLARPRQLLASIATSIPKPAKG
ncbi:unnamed protein product, partial [Prorocentrum cordatum]